MIDESNSTEPIARKAYSSFAERYAELAPTKPHNALYERPVTTALLGDVRGQRILDAGCGPGIYSASIVEAGATVHGIDVVPEMIELASKRCPDPAASFRIADLSAPLDWLDDESFDKVLSALALDHVEELAPVFREFYRITKPGGVIVFSMSHPMHDWTNEDIRQDSVYYERSRFGIYWKSFGQPYPYVEAYRRPFSETLNTVAATGWILDRLEEPRPLPEMRQVAESTYRRLLQAPEFICIRARK